MFGDASRDLRRDCVSPRTGGEADKFGNRYEGRWTVRHLLDVLAGRAKSITVEETGTMGEGIEFSVERNDGMIEGHQVKRQRGNANAWSIRNLSNLGIWAAAESQVAKGRQFHFVSLIPARTCDELSDRARRADDAQAFVDGLGTKLRSEFDLAVKEFASAARAFEVLRGTFVRWPDEREVRETNAALAGLLLSGAPGPAAAAVLGDLVSDNLGKALDASAIRKLLHEYEIYEATLLGAPDVRDSVQRIFETWDSSVARELLRPEIPRPETSAIRSALRASAATIFATGSAGAGKSAALRQAVAELRDEWPLLAMRLDRIEPFSSTHELGVNRLGLTSSPVSSLAAVADGRDCLLVIDQLDAVSRASGRMPASFDAVADLLREAKAFPNMRVLVACRGFDIDNDDRLRDLISGDQPIEQISIGQLDDAQVGEAIAQMGLDPAAMSGSQLALLRSPLNLVLLAAIADHRDAGTFATAKDLMDAFYDRKRRACRERRPDVRFADTLGALAAYMSENQRLVAPAAVLDAGDLLDDADVLSSEHVVVRDGQQIAFFHEALFDYVFARRWIVRGESLVEFLVGGEQELFRRAQVRQILAHLRDEDPARFVAEVGGVLDSSKVRFHIKEVVLAILRSLPNPTQAEWHLVETQLAAGHPFAALIWSGLRAPAWFARLDQEGAVERWLASRDPDLEARALEIMSSAAAGQEARLAELLLPFVKRDEYPAWLRWVVGYRTRICSRELFDLVVDAVRKGHYDDAGHDLWMSAQGLGEHPETAAELLEAWLGDRPEAFKRDAQGRIAALTNDDYGANELLRKAAKGAPAAFCRRMLPFLLRAMATTAYGDDRPRHDHHFTHRTWNGNNHDLADHVLHATADALRQLATDDLSELDELLSALAGDEHDSAQWLLYQALIAAGARRADQAAELLLEGDHRLYSGYSCDSYWTTRELLQAISPTVSAERFRDLERLIMAVGPEWESPPGGYSQFTLLSALAEDRLSDAGRRRLGGLRRRFSRPQPDTPTGVQVGSFGPPIPESAAQHMTDDQWLRAIATHNTDELDWQTMSGGAREQGQVLEAATSADPARFAQLGLGLDASSHPAYVNAILRGLGSPEAEADADLVFQYIRHVARLGRNSEHDAWLAWPLRRQLAEDIPDDIIQLVVERALDAPESSDDAWLRDSENGQKYYRGDPFHNGMNTARGSAVLTLGDLLGHDADGHRTGLVVYSFDRLATDPSVAVRTCVAHLLAAGLRHARPRSVEAFQRLIETDDRLLAASPVETLMVHIGFGEPAVVGPVIERMLGSEFENVREAGGRMAAFAGLELDIPELLTAAVGSSDPLVRKGAAVICARRLPITGDHVAALRALLAFIHDESPAVRDAAAEVAAALRDRPLEPHRDLLSALIASPAITDAMPQLLITLERATERVDDLVKALARRFLDMHQNDMNDFATRTAGDAKQIGELVMRAYAQAHDAIARKEALDLVDDLLSRSAWGFSEMVVDAER